VVSSCSRAGAKTWRPTKTAWPSSTCKRAIDVTAIADVRDLEAVSRVAADGAAELGPIDIVVANAGICTFDEATQMSQARWLQMIDINLSGPWRTVKAALPHLADGASIILTSSTAGLKGYPNVSHYVAAKHGLVGLARSLGNELGGRGIRVNTVHPTQVETDMLLNEGTYRMFRPDLENPDLDDFKVASQMGMALPTPWVQSSTSPTQCCSSPPTRRGS
jgi:NAD(P)-dependent dehydrogenase (short-subunit alcohol dehydrogenase family)